MIKLGLNTRKFNTYAFFCPVSRLHLTVSNPVGYADRVTPAILRALKSKTILDIDGVVDIAAGELKASLGNEQSSTEDTSSKTEEVKEEETKEETVEEEKETTTKKTTTRKSRSKKTTETAEEEAIEE